MRFLKRAFFALLILIVVAVAVSFLLPRHIQVTRAVTINAQEADIFPHLNDLKKFHVWSPWSLYDAKATYTYSDPISGPGAKMSWKSEVMGEGEMKIASSAPNKRIDYALDFGEQGNATSYFTLQPKRDNTEVVWGFETDMGPIPPMRWMGFMMSYWIGADYEKGLARLKRLVETGKAE